MSNLLLKPETDNSQNNSSPNQPVAVDNSQNNLSQNQPAGGVDYLKPVNDTFVIPGKRIGLITADTNRADLVKIHGETNLKDDVR